MLALIASIAVIVELARRTNKSAGELFSRCFGALTRPTERKAITGATFLAFVCLVAVALLSRSAAIATMWCATVGDPLATVAGRLWRLANAYKVDEQNAKTLVGSVTCVVTSFLGVSMLAGYSPVAALLIAVAAAVAEAIPSEIDDNLRVAAAAGIASHFLA